MNRVMAWRVETTLLSQISDCLNSTLALNGDFCAMHVLTKVPIRTTIRLERPLIGVLI